jgi:DNA-binding GntR family transcriptional regulator
MGYKTSTKLISLEKTAIPAGIARKMQLDKETTVYVVKRLRYVKANP